MSNLQTYVCRVALDASEFTSNPVVRLLKVVKKLERGDADSSGSTVRTALVVVIVMGVLATFALAVGSLGDRIGARVDGLLTK